LTLPLGIVSASGQQAASSDAVETPKPPAEEKITLAQTQATWEKIQADPGVDQSIKDLLQPKFEQAIDDLKKAEEFQKTAEAFRNSIETSPAEAEQKREELAQLPTTEQAAVVDKSFDSTAALQRELAGQSTLLETLSEELETVSAELASLREKRPAAISSRQPEAQTELEKVQAQLQNPDLAQDASSPGRIAERAELLALEAKLSAELDMLKQEKLSATAREELLEARSEWLTQRVANLAAKVKGLQALEQTRLKQEAEQAGSVVTSTKDAIAKDDLPAQELLWEVAGLTKQFDKLVNVSAEISELQAKLSDRLKRLNNEFDRLSQELDVEGAGSTMAQMAFQLQARVLDPEVFAVPPAPSIPSVDSIRLASLQVDQQLRDQPTIEERFSRRNSEAIDQLVATRGELLGKLNSQYKKVLPAKITLESTKHQLARRNEQVLEAISEELIWLRSSPPIRVRDLISIPGGLRWTFSVDHWQKFCDAVGQAYQHDPLRFIGILSLAVVLLTLRPRMIRSLELTGERTRRISTDRYFLSWEALFWTALLAAPLAILLMFFSWAVSNAESPSAWLQSLAGGTPAVARIAYIIAFTSELCRPKGLGNAHFGWDQSKLDATRSTLFRFGLVYIPANLIACSTLYGDASRYADGIGRVSIIVSKLWICFLLWQQFGGRDGLVAILKEKHPDRLLTRTRMLWYPLMLLAPILVAVLAARGYVIASIKLSHGFAETLGVIVLGDVAYWMVLRWFSLKARRMLVADRMERLRAAREAAKEAGEEGYEHDENVEAITIAAEEEESLDLEKISQQTRSMIRSLIGIGIAFIILSLWSSQLPIADLFRGIAIPLTGGIDLFELMQATLLLAITWVIIKNLPGVLELSVFSTSSIESGTRYAITTLCRYGIGIIGSMAIINVLNFDWTQFGWMAAALSVGLGFGLQEVITNFVCGLILLFERPVRIGDVVTIQGVTGTVTRIRMRATTITNWDRQEFVVPNKSLITDTILNWTLSASISRVVINVGVAYGTDTVMARQILLDVAKDHPIIMDEPPPMATFEQFGDSALTLILRCYVPDLDYRLRTISELHTEIDHRFAEAGIEIAFPQQDIHIRSGLDVLRRRKRSKKPSAGLQS
jgi:potassium efflux system protein